MTQRSDPFKKREGKPSAKQSPVDPANGMKTYGVHGEREAPVVLPPTSRRIHTVPISAIRPGRYQKRESVDPERYQQLKDQIQELGLNFVAILCVDPDDATFYNPMMGGHLRIQAAAELGITEVSAIIRDYDRMALAKGTYFENNGRQPLSLIEEGNVFKQCQEDAGWTQEEIAKNLIVPGGRSHVALCLLTVTAAPDIQEMLRRDPKRGQRCFYYLRQLDELGEERAIELRAPIIADFLAKKISTDEVRIKVEQILQSERGEASSVLTLEEVRRQHTITSTMKNFHRFEKEIGTTAPSQKERETLLTLRQKIEDLLDRR
jgi:ParB/RepB/Spo0J family partition protein